MSRLPLLCLLLSSACIIPPSTIAELADADADGDFSLASGGTDCDDDNPAVNGLIDEICGDGLDNDCDGRIDDVAPDAPWWHPDIDADTFGDAAGGVQACEAPPGFILDGADCDDASAAVHPGAAEQCDDVDNDCDEQIDEAGTPREWFLDADGDDHGTGERQLVQCKRPEGPLGQYTGDCNDDDATIHPGAEETHYDGIDQDCDPAFENDADEDGFDADFAGGVDCDDQRAEVNPSAEEVFYDGTDQDCDPTNEWDADGDGHSLIGAPDGTADDCDDTSHLVFPGAPELYYDGIDQDCEPANEWDADLDGHTVEGATVGTADDCDDTNPDVRPGATEIWYDGIDQDCDAWSDFDQDLDGHDLTGGDCDDTNAAVNPGATEVCDNGIDDDCDGSPGTCEIDTSYDLDELWIVTDWIDGEPDDLRIHTGSSYTWLLVSSSDATDDTMRVYELDQLVQTELDDPVTTLELDGLARWSALCDLDDAGEPALLVRSLSHHQIDVWTQPWSGTLSTTADHEWSLAADEALLAACLPLDGADALARIDEVSGGAELAHMEVSTAGYGSPSTGTAVSLDLLPYLMSSSPSASCMALSDDSWCWSDLPTSASEDAEHDFDLTQLHQRMGLTVASYEGEDPVLFDADDGPTELPLSLGEWATPVRFEGGTGPDVAWARHNLFGDFYSLRLIRQPTPADAYFPTTWDLDLPLSEQNAILTALQPVPVPSFPHHDAIAGVLYDEDNDQFRVFVLAGQGF